MATPILTIPRPPAGGSSSGGPSRNRIIIIGVAGCVIVLCLIILMARGCGSTKPAPKSTPSSIATTTPTTTTPPTATPATSPTSPVVTPARPSPMSASRLAAAPASTNRPAARTSAAPVTASSQELVRELRRINSRLGEIRGVLERQPAAIQPTPATQFQPQRRHEQLSDRELERRYKEWVFSREPQRQQEEEHQ